MESTSLPNKIQVSENTANLIIECGKGSWLSARKDLVNAKGKGMLQTYWLDPKRGRASSTISSTSDLEIEHPMGSDLGQSTCSFASLGMETEATMNKHERLIDWNVALFEELLQAIVKRREQIKARGGQVDRNVTESIYANDVSIRDEAVKTICMPQYESLGVLPSQNQRVSVGLNTEVVAQLRSYVSSIAHLYNSQHAFHGFEHASHVVMSTIKLLQRVATPDVKKKEVSNLKEYYDYTYGLGSDPLTKFGIVFAALIHDVDHQGVSNT